MIDAGERATIPCLSRDTDRPGQWPRLLEEGRPDFSGTVVLITATLDQDARPLVGPPS